MADHNPTELLQTEIFIVGLGAVGISQVTPEVDAALRSSKVVFVVDNNPGVDEYLHSVCPRVENLMGAYRLGENRLGAYDRMATAVLEAAIDTPPVTFAVYGHPRLYVYPSQEIIEVASHLGLQCRVLPGISTVDVILCDLGLDPGLHGLQMYEASDAMVRGRPLQPDVPCLLLQVGSLETGISTLEPSRPERFERFQRYLSSFYDDSHIISVLSVATVPGQKARIVSFPLRRMVHNAGQFTIETTLYIPPARLRPIVYAELLRDMQSPDHLKNIVVAK